jgi:hypothetical protein
VTTSESRLTKTLAYARAHGVKAALEVVVNFILPFLIYSYGAGTLGAVRALMAASAPPILWSIIAFVGERKVDAISILVLSGIALSLLAFAGGGGVKFLQLRENLVAGLVGLVFLGSVAIGKPLIYQLARAGTRRRSADRAQAFEALRDDPRFRRDMMVATLVWGLGLLAACALNCVLVFMISIKQYLLISAPISYASLALLTAWTFWYVPLSKRRAEARQSVAR